MTISAEQASELLREAARRLEVNGIGPASIRDLESADLDVAIALGVREIARQFVALCRDSGRAYVEARRLYHANTRAGDTPRAWLCDAVAGVIERGEAC